MATPTVSSRFVPVAPTVWVQLRLDALAAAAPVAPGPTPSKVTAAATVATVIETVAVCVRLPLTPVIVSEELPGGVAALGVTVSVADAVAGLGLKLPVAPAGSPLTLKVTAAVKPPVGAIDTA